MKKLLVLLLFASIAIPGGSFGLARGESQDAWFVRTIVDSDEPICEGATLFLELRDRSRHVIANIDIPIEQRDKIDRDWLVHSEPGTLYSLNVQIASCSGLRTDRVELEFEVSSEETGRTVYVAVRYDKGRTRLTYLETNVNYSGLLSLSEDEDGMIISNVSARPIDRCMNRFIDRIEREYLVEGQWGVFNHSKTYSWPDDLESLLAGASMAVQEPKVYSIYDDPNARKVRPDRKRLKVFSAIDEGQYRILSTRGDVPLGLPGCNLHYIDTPVTDRDPAVQVWTK